LGAVAMIQGDLYCKNCFVRMFQERGTYTVFKAGADRVKAPTKEEEEREAASVVAEECTVFTPQAWKPTKCKLCHKEKSEHSEEARKSLPTPTVEAKAPATPSASKGTPSGKKKPCKFGFRAHPDKWRKDTCTYCGLSEAEHTGAESSAPSSPLGQVSGDFDTDPASAPSSPTPVSRAVDFRDPYSRTEPASPTSPKADPETEGFAPSASKPTVDVSGDEAIFEASSGPQTSSTEDEPVVATPKEESGFERMQRFRREAEADALKKKQEKGLSLESLFEKHSLSGILSPELQADLRQWKADPSAE